MLYSTALDILPDFFDNVKKFNTGSISKPSNRHSCSLAYQCYYATLRAYPEISGEILRLLFESGKMLLHDDVLETINNIGVDCLQANLIRVITTVTSPCLHAAPHQVQQLYQMHISTPYVFSCIEKIHKKEPTSRIPIGDLLKLAQEFAKLSKSQADDIANK